MESIAISLKNVSKYYKLYDCPKKRLREALHPLRKQYHKKFYALNNIDIEIKKGEILGVLGRNGSGKSTLLKLITGVLQPDEGSINVNGKITALLELGAGFNPEFTGLDNIGFYSQILGLTDEQIKEKLPSIIAFAELGEFLNQPVKTYSSGMKSRLGFSVAIHIDPEILILDEVLAVGDEAFKAKCYRKINEFIQKSKTVILVSHSIHTINQLCNSAVLIEDGNIVKSGKTKEVTEFYHECLFGEATKKKKNTKAADSNRSSKNKAFWTDGIVIKKTRMKESEELTHSNFRMLNSTGDVVNILNYNETYTFQFELSFNDFNFDLDSLLIGFTFVTSKGIHLCGVEPKNIEKLSNNKYLLSAKFLCIFAEDIYTIISSVRLRSAEIMYLSRIENIGAYKVINNYDSFHWGLVHLLPNK